MNNSIVEGILAIPEVRIGLIDFAIRILDKTKDFLVELREKENNKLLELKASKVFGIF